MSIVMNRGWLGVMGAGVVAMACTVGVESSGMDESGGADESSTGGPAGDTSGASNDPEPGDSSDGGGGSSGGGPGGPVGDDDSSGGGGSTDDGTPADESGTGSGGEIVYDEEFLWVADFLRTNCVTCHATNMNGNLVLGSADIDDEGVRLALENVMATTGLLLVEPFDRQASQTWLQITNEFGAQFPVEDTDRFGAWIDAGAPYYAP